MKTALLSAAAAALVGIVSAGHGHVAAHRHQQLVARKACEEMCTTEVKTYYGDATLVYNPHTKSEPTTSDYASATEPPKTPKTYNKTTPKKQDEKPKAKEASSPAEPKKNDTLTNVPLPGGYVVPGGITGNTQDHWAIAYTPFRETANGGCKSRDEIYADLQRIKGMGFNTLRIYSTECDILKHVGDACTDHGLKIIAGVFVKEKGCGLSGENKKQVEDLAAWKRWDIVSAIIIGNEAVFGNLCSASQLKGLVEGAKGMLMGAGFPGPYMTAETVNVWEQHGDELCGCVDVPGANIHAYFDGGVEPANAGNFVKSQLAIVEKKCGKKALTTESGWPTEGNSNGHAIPGYSQQKQAIDSIRATCGTDVVFFAYGKAFWKGASQCNCEPYFNVEASF